MSPANVRSICEVCGEEIFFSFPKRFCLPPKECRMLAQSQKNPRKMCKCQRCLYAWRSRRKDLPLSCPACQSRKWNGEASAAQQQAGVTLVLCTKCGSPTPKDRAFCATCRTYRPHKAFYGGLTIMRFGVLRAYCLAYQGPDPFIRELKGLFEKYSLSQEEGGEIPQEIAQGKGGEERREEGPEPKKEEEMILSMEEALQELSRFQGQVRGEVEEGLHDQGKEQERTV